MRRSSTSGSDVMRLSYWAVVATSILAVASMPATLNADVVQVAASHPDAGADSSSSCPPDMVQISPGSVSLGSAVSGIRSQSRPPNPPHVAYLRGFCIDRLEISVGAYKSCPWCARSARSDAGTPGSRGRDLLCEYGSDQLPIRCITQQESEQYCSSGGRRLPTSDEWEYAARGTDQRMYPWGNAIPRTTISRFREVGSDQRDISPSGVADLQGNIGEWVSDRVPLAPSGQCGVVRGVAMLTESYPEFPGAVVFTGCDVPTVFVGFRCAMDAP